MPDSSQNFAAENGLQSQFAVLRALPRQARREVLPGLAWRVGAKRLGPLATIFVLFSLFPLLIIPSVLSGQRQTSNRLPVNARVVRSEVVSTPSGSNQIKTRFFKYRFRANNREFVGSALAAQNAPLNAIRVGDTVSIRYDARNPQQNAPDLPNPNENFPWPIFVLFPLMIAVCFVPLMWPTLQVWLLARQLCARGNLTQGEIVWIRPRANTLPQNSSQAGEVTYRWRDSDNGMREGTIVCDNFWLMGQWSENTPVVVAFDPKKPARNVILEPFVR